MAAEATTPCTKCASFTVQRRSDGLYCLVCGIRREGHRTKTVPTVNVRPHGQSSQRSLDPEERMTVQRCHICGSTSMELWSTGRHCRFCGTRLPANEWDIGGNARQREDEEFDRFVGSFFRVALQVFFGLLLAYFIFNLVLAAVYNLGYSDSETWGLSESIATNVPALDLTRYYLMEVSSTRTYFYMNEGQGLPFIVAYAIIIVVLIYGTLRTFGINITKATESKRSIPDNVDWSSGGSIGLDQMPLPGSAQRPSMNTPPLTQTPSVRSIIHQAAPGMTSPRSHDPQVDRTHFLEQRLNVKIEQLIEGSVTLHTKSAEGTLVYQISQSVDRQITSAVSNVLARGRPVIARSTWASRKKGNGNWEPVFVACFGEPGARRPNVVLAVLAVSDFSSSAASFSAIANRVTILSPEKSELYVMPPVVLWDGSVSPRGNIMGHQFRGAIVSGAALRPVHYAILGTTGPIGQPFQSLSMGNDVVGAIRITQFQPNIFDQDVGGGERF